MRMFRAWAPRLRGYARFFATMRVISLGIFEGFVGSAKGFSRERNSHPYGI